MSLNSFRLKIALLSGGITGLLLVGTGLAGWRISYQFNLDRLDREIRNLGQANLERVPGREHWVRLDDALRFVSGRQESAGYVLCVKNDGQTVYQSPEWPRQLPLEPFATPFGDGNSTTIDSSGVPQAASNPSTRRTRAPRSSWGKTVSANVRRIPPSVSNKRAGGDGGMSLRADVERPWPAAPEHER